MNEKTAWAEDMKVAALAPAGLRSRRGVNPLPLSDNPSRSAFLSPFWNYRLLGWFYMVKMVKNLSFNAFLHNWGTDF
jgi:hypothetical protein